MSEPWSATLMYSLSWRWSRPRRWPPCSSRGCTPGPGGRRRIRRAPSGSGRWWLVAVVGLFVAAAGAACRCQTGRGTATAVIARRCFRASEVPLVPGADPPLRVGQPHGSFRCDPGHMASAGELPGGCQAMMAGGAAPPVDPLTGRAPRRARCRVSAEPRDSARAPATPEIFTGLPGEDRLLDPVGPRHLHQHVAHGDVRVVDDLVVGQASDPTRPLPASAAAASWRVSDAAQDSMPGRSPSPCDEPIRDGSPATRRSATLVCPISPPVP